MNFACEGDDEDKFFDVEERKRDFNKDVEKRPFPGEERHLVERDRATNKKIMPDFPVEERDQSSNVEKRLFRGEEKDLVGRDKAPVKSFTTFDVEERDQLSSVERRHFPGEEKRNFPGEEEDAPTEEKRRFRYPEHPVGEAERDEYHRAFYPGGMPPGTCVFVSPVFQLSKAPFTRNVCLCVCEKLQELAPW